MPSYSTPASNASMEAWYPLSGLWFSRIWAQTMRQISRRCADMNITCNWRSSVNTGAPVQYPADDFMLGCTGFAREAGNIYLGKMLDYLEQACEASKVVDCKKYYFAPSVNIPYAGPEDGAQPMIFTAPAWDDTIQDKPWPYVGSYWKEIMGNIRAVVDGLNRLKTMQPIPHPGLLYDLVVLSTSESYEDAYTYTGADNVVAADEEWYVDAPTPSFNLVEGYRIEKETAGLMPLPTSGTPFTPTGNKRLELECNTKVSYNISGYPDGAPEDNLPDRFPLDTVSSGTNQLVSWTVIRKFTRTRTIGFSSTNWAAYKAAYGVTDTMQIPVYVNFQAGGVLFGENHVTPTFVPRLRGQISIDGTPAVDSTVDGDDTVALIGTIQMVGGQFQVQEVYELVEADLADVNLFRDEEWEYDPPWEIFANRTDWAGYYLWDYSGSFPTGWFSLGEDGQGWNGGHLKVGISAGTWGVPEDAETLDECDLAA